LKNYPCLQDHDQPLKLIAAAVAYTRFQNGSSFFNRIDIWQARYPCGGEQTDDVLADGFEPPQKSLQILRGELPAFVSCIARPLFGLAVWTRDRNEPTFAIEPLLDGIVVLQLSSADSPKGLHVEAENVVENCDLPIRGVTAGRGVSGHQLQDIAIMFDQLEIDAWVRGTHRAA